jgi:antitoxin ParD1/3/4
VFKQIIQAMNISLTPELEQFVESTVKSGRYPSATEVVIAALRLLEEREMERLVRLEELRKEIAIGIEHSDRGDVFDGEEVLRELREEIWLAEQGEE